MNNKLKIVESQRDSDISLSDNLIDQILQSSAKTPSDIFIDESALLNIVGSDLIIDDSALINCLGS
jgi:hypothetical protein